MRLPLLAVCLACVAGIAGAQRNPFAPPSATIHYAPDRAFDLQNLDIDIDIDYPNKTIRGRTINTLQCLRSGTSDVLLHAGTGLQISGVKVNGKPANFTRNDRELHISIASLARGEKIAVETSYTGSNQTASPFGGKGGWHWILPRNNEPFREGCWTQGETEFNSEWAPTWDYPNDLTTSSCRITVQSDWDAISNGILVSTTKTPDGKRKTVQWRMDKPHATYLLTICAGPFDIKRDKWEGVDLWYVVPRGKGSMIEDSFGDTKDMLSFYSKILGVKYPWPKYAQNAMYDFSGGMENVTATTLGESALVDRREGFRRMASVNSHELGHQWFGDYVTCKDWGDTWLNESFATFMQTIYFEHSRGPNAYDAEISSNTRSYLAEARQYKRPISTKLYTNGQNMFDSHTYPKGGTVLHMLRRQLGDEAFFAGLNLYLRTWANTPVQSSQLCRAMTEASGINCEKFWDQWFLKPGHPVLEYSWNYDATGGQVVVTVKQAQDTADGTPIYDMPLTIGLLTASSSGSEYRSQSVHIDSAEQKFVLRSSSKPTVVLLDPNRDLLRELRTKDWDQNELYAIAKLAPSSVDASDAFRRLMSTEPPAWMIDSLAQDIAKDATAFPRISNVSYLGGLARPELRPLWLKMLDHASMQRQIEGALALSKLPSDASTIAKFRSLVTDQAPIGVVITVVEALSNWDAKGNKDVFERALKIASRGDRIKRAATAALEKAK